VGTSFHRAFFGMTMRDATWLAESLRQPNILQHLTIRSSAVDDDKCLLLAHALQENTCLTYLDLSHNYLGNKSARALAKVLARPGCAMETLILHNNAIGQEGAQSLGKALARNTRLKLLDLGLNDIQDAGGVSLLECLERNNVLEEVDLPGNGLGSEAVISLCSLLKRNGSTLRRFDVSCNSLGAGPLVIHDLRSVPAAEELVNAGSSVHQTAADVSGSILLDAINRNKVRAVACTCRAVGCTII
jgi:hypothetical protein